jgi:hypothetical protein
MRIRMMYERQGKTEGGIGAGGNDQDHEHARTLLSRHPYPSLEDLQTTCQTPDQELIHTFQPRDMNRKKDDAWPWNYDRLRVYIATHTLQITD